MDNMVIDASAHKTRSRFWILAVLFIISTVNYADRSTLSIAGPHMARDLGLDPLQMGYIFSAFGWAYTLAQLPCGWLLDKFGSKKVYGCAILIWSVFTFCQGFSISSPMPP